MAADRRRRDCRSPRFRASIKIAFAILVAVLVAGATAAVRTRSRVPDEGVVLCAVRLRLQSADRLWRAAVVRPCDVFRLGILCRGPSRQGRDRQPAVLGRCLELAGGPAAAIAGDRHIGGHAGRSGARRDRRRRRDPPPGHLFRHDHAGPGADDVLLCAAGEIHRRRGRHPGRAARAAVRDHRPLRHHGDVCLRRSWCSSPHSSSSTASSIRRSARC